MFVAQALQLQMMVAMKFNEVLEEHGIIVTIMQDVISRK